MNLSIKETLRAAWTIFKKNMWVFVGATVFLFILSVVSDKLNKNATGSLEFIFNIGTVLLMWWLYAGFIRMLLTSQEGGVVSFKQLFGESWETLLRYAIGAILTGIIVFVPVLVVLFLGLVLFVGVDPVKTVLLTSPFLMDDGLTLLVAFSKDAGMLTVTALPVFLVSIIIGVFLQFRLLFVPLLVVDKGIKGQDAVKESWRLTRGHLLRLLSVSIVLVGINIIGTLALIVGLFVTVPLSFLVLVQVYSELERGMAPTVVPQP